MSQRKPRGLLSFIRNTTGVAAYRDEMHVDMRAAFERFGITDGAVQAVCFDVERAAYEIRRSSDDRFGRHASPFAASRHSAARKLMAESSLALFRELSNDLSVRLLAREELAPGLDLAHEVRKDAPPSGVVRGEGPIELHAERIEVVAERELGEAPLLLDIVYYFFHFPSTRAPLLSSHALERAVDAIAQKSGERNLYAQVHEGLTALDHYLRAGEPASRVSSLVERLCELLAVEYDDRASCYCW
ncbi:MAG TPA: hypothetical protein VFQ35_12620 [Polyangiaceae bacterium]|nr:hypothetical protein [Polyangiaceae bacterium]